MTEAASSERGRRARLANMRQELLAPVAALVGYGELLTEEALRLDLEEIIPDLERILTSAKELLELVDRMLDERPPPISRRAPISTRSRSGCGTICATP